MLWLQSSISTVAQELWYSHWCTCRSEYSMLSGTLAPFAPDGREQRLADIQIQRVAELVLLRRARGLDAGRQVARVVPPEAGFAERAEQILQRLESEEVERLVGDFELHLGVLARRPRPARLPAGRRAPRMVICPSSTIFCTRRVEQLVHLLGRHVAAAAPSSPASCSSSKSLPSSSACWMAFFRSSSVCWFHSLKGMYWVLKPLWSRKSERACSRVVGADAEILAGVLAST